MQALHYQREASGLWMPPDMHTPILPPSRRQRELLAADYAQLYNRGYNANYSSPVGAAGGGGPSWPVDATKGWAVPTSSAHWTAFLTSLGLGSVANPTDTFPLQEASGDAVGAIAGTTLTPTNTPTQGQTDINWTRLCVETGAASAQRMLNTTFADAAANTINILLMCRYTEAPGASQGILVAGSNNDLSITSGSASQSVFRYREDANILQMSTGFSTNDQLLWVQHNIDGLNAGASPRARVANLAELLSPTYGSVTGSNFTLGSITGLTSAPMRFFWMAVWVGTGGEISSANMKTIMGGLTGVTPSWTAA